jgi:hypothetical protein
MCPSRFLTCCLLFTVGCAELSTSRCGYRSPSLLDRLRGQEIVLPTPPACGAGAYGGRTPYTPPPFPVFPSTPVVRMPLPAALYANTQQVWPEFLREPPRERGPDLPSLELPGHLPDLPSGQRSGVVPPQSNENPFNPKSFD